jgi:hypothetical protein
VAFGKAQLLSSRKEGFPKVTTSGPVKNADEYFMSRVTSISFRAASPLPTAIDEDDKRR